MTSPACRLLPGASSAKHGHPDVRGQRACSRLPEVQVCTGQRAAADHPLLPAGKGERGTARLEEKSKEYLTVGGSVYLAGSVTLVGASGKDKSSRAQGQMGSQKRLPTGSAMPRLFQSGCWGKNGVKAQELGICPHPLLLTEGNPCGAGCGCWLWLWTRHPLPWAALQEGGGDGHQRGADPGGQGHPLHAQHLLPVSVRTARSAKGRIQLLTWRWWFVSMTAVRASWHQRFHLMEFLLWMGIRLPEGVVLHPRPSKNPVDSAAPTSGVSLSLAACAPRRSCRSRRAPWTC